jgi:hypothetical protein
MLMVTGDFGMFCTRFPFFYLCPLCFDTAWHFSSQLSACRFPQPFIQMHCIVWASLEILRVLPGLQRANIELSLSSLAHFFMYSYLNGLSRIVE